MNAITILQHAIEHLLHTSYHKGRFDDDATTDAYCILFGALMEAYG